MQVNKDNFRDFTPETVQGSVELVKLKSNADEAQFLIHYFHFMLRDGGLFDNVQLSPIERAFVDYVEHAFARITEEGESTQIAFGLQLRRGKHPREDTSDRDFIATAYIILLMRKNWTWKDAKGEAANLLFPVDKGDKAVEAAYAKHRDELRICSDEALVGFLPRGTAIKSFMRG